MVISFFICTMRATDWLMVACVRPWGSMNVSHSMEDTCIYVLTHGMKLLRDILHYDEFT